MGFYKLLAFYRYILYFIFKVSLPKCSEEHSGVWKTKMYEYSRSL